MRRVELDSLPKETIQLINEKNPLSEDIGIYDKNGDLSSVIITPAAYAYFLKKIEEDEDKQDSESLTGFDSAKELESAKSIDDFLNEDK
ncbi:hypothetical protein MSP8887_02159 [Marinomonas spartinae]|uniref:Uncharacterized protein n=1 Tax=Marinomonas spartinae TaxID=1792290 RepID=A0A1A8TL40_9GAMM|nr:hypothetical protein [Marinomonas spartinae]SBS33468.1 hypothetical protein MSP8886_02762 [Marinomonas spartinae]SBS34473.1 hypothetical protein MSP8887_02159 [Marinomonas spartinae]